MYVCFLLSDIMSQKVVCFKSVEKVSSIISPQLTALAWIYILRAKHVQLSTFFPNISQSVGYSNMDFVCAHFWKFVLNLAWEIFLPSVKPISELPLVFITFGKCFVTVSGSVMEQPNLCEKNNALTVFLGNLHEFLVNLKEVLS